MLNRETVFVKLKYASFWKNRGEIIELDKELFKREFFNRWEIVEKPKLIKENVEKDTLIDEFNEDNIKIIDNVDLKEVSIEDNMKIDTKITDLSNDLEDNELDINTGEIKSNEVKKMVIDTPKIKENKNIKNKNKKSKLKNK